MENRGYIWTHTEFVYSVLDLAAAAKLSSAQLAFLRGVGDLANYLGWPEAVSISQKTAQKMTRLSVKTINKAKQELKDIGIIDFEPGKYTNDGSGGEACKVYLPTRERMWLLHRKFNVEPQFSYRLIPPSKGADIQAKEYSEHEDDGHLPKTEKNGASNQKTDGKSHTNFTRRKSINMGGMV